MLTKFLKNNLIHVGNFQERRFLGINKSKNQCKKHGGGLSIYIYTYIQNIILLPPPLLYPTPPRGGGIGGWG
jgi:hypothetical protein